MIRARKEEGYTLLEMLIVLAILLMGTMAFPEIKQIKTAAKLTGVEENYRSVITTIYSLKHTDEIIPKLIDLFGDSASPKIEDMTNPFTNKTGVATILSPADELVPAVYVFKDTSSTIPSKTGQSDYKGAIVVVIKNDRCVVYGCDEMGKLIKGFQRTINL
ncbi:type II secretion system protein [Desulfosporosinus sp. SYSU MS00001]|uniref:type II secretion system protein n=1 Tax=Desulfosporosinus sp. SYSU MS00001 TaxID=3416284 RepID=UPI003CF5030A